MTEEFELNSITCECGNVIEYTDEWTTGCRYNDDEVLICNKCKKKIKVSVNGFIGDLKGAKVK